MKIHDPAGLSLNSTDKSRDPAAIDKVARDLEGAFARMLISSMRQSGLGGDDALFPGAAGQYRDLYDAQLAQALTQGQGLGLQAAIKRQLASHASALQTPDNSPKPPQKPAPMLPLTTPAAGLPLAPSTPVSLDQPVSRYEQPALRQTAAARFQETGRTDSPEDFVARIWPQAEKAAAALGVPTKMLVAQAALETGWGRHLPRTADGSVSANLFGIKAGSRWQGGSVTAATTEVENGVARREEARFRTYDSSADSFADYVALLKNDPRYADTVGKTDGHAFARALQQAGYATDPDYAAKLTAIAEGPTLRRALEALAGSPATTSVKV